ncbi:MAG: PAS domain-containing sensor histidine kinase [Alphaproteobacteria bacterium]|nr:PAS domain-containing sensor histidine kinase [Alphaproteobacteria bacterium]
MTEVASGDILSLWRRLEGWAEQVGLARKIAILLGLASVVAAIATYLTFSGVEALPREPRPIVLLLTLDVVLLLLLAALVSRRLIGIWADRRREGMGSGLHRRLALLFSFVALAPTLVVTVFAALFLHLGIQSWFDDVVRKAVNESHAVARLYLDEHQKSIRGDILLMAQNIAREAPALMSSQQRFNALLTAWASSRSLSEAVVFTESGGILARAGLTFALEFEPLGADIVDRASEGEVVLFSSENEDRVRAVVQLDRFIGAYLMIGRVVDSTALAYAERTRRAVEAYQQIETRAAGLQFSFIVWFAAVALLLLLAAIWLGLTFANQLARPISGMARAAERVRAGDLGARVEQRPATDEIGVLAQAFNRMTEQLEAQRGDLMEANRQLDVRRRFIEAVLSGVSAGVIGIDGEGRITLPNRSAAMRLGVQPESLAGRPLVEAIPELAPLWDEVRRRPDKLAEDQVEIVRGGRTRILLARLGVDTREEQTHGYVLTFDDVTELLTAQRQAAWADVARRIAHEIKNPLTPIQLSAERLKRRYLKEIQSDPDTFRACTDTIVRQVGDIGRMVDEFSSFARMPRATIKPEAIQSICDEAVFLQRQNRSSTAVELDMPESPLILPCDARQLRQAVTNLLKNAGDAIDGRPTPISGALPPGRIKLTLALDSGETRIEVTDNGKGLPVDGRDRLTEPYVTTRTKGTGLGLAIVKKIAEDHGGRLVLGDNEGGGAKVALILPGGSLGEVERTGARVARHGA